MYFRVFIPIILLLWSARAGGAPAQRVGEAEVRDAKKGQPCFTISEREERRGGAPDFEAISVIDTSARPRETMWKMSMPSGRTFPVMFSMCIPYAGRVQSLPQTRATELEPGRVYEVTIDVRSGGTPEQARSYGARFCLVRQRDGDVKVLPIAPGAREGKNSYGCMAGK
ncbi:hypothetical protein Q4S45_14370 [Massilia sp. R2A-15]|uniref:hypothetical protein n=1 Tax=Massilia sp. R2A-15 TaxID=3064278 RepID=UPI00273711B6|nr:hypothetical protein [Massilia sp. R2A-15]WLI87923.1 hypothetical protein Q4S45_14370 [Massilia sp. R2A-15]